MSLGHESGREGEVVSWEAAYTCDICLMRVMVGCPQDPKENSFPAQKGTHEANLMLACSNRSEASSVGGPSE